MRGNHARVKREWKRVQFGVRREFRERFGSERGRGPYERCVRAT
jgi:hypothetical protein